MRTQFYHAIQQIEEERESQIVEHACTAEVDNEYMQGELAQAAAAYALAFKEPTDRLWPWVRVGEGRSTWKPSTHRRNVVKAAALLIAELERLERMGE